MVEKGEQEEKKNKSTEEGLFDGFDSILEKRYGIGIKDTLDRLNKTYEQTDTMNQELGGVVKTVTSIDKKIGILNERTNNIKNIQYALIGGTFGTLVGIILMLVQLMT